MDDDPRFRLDRSVLLREIENAADRDSLVNILEAELCRLDPTRAPDYDERVRRAERDELRDIRRDAKRQRRSHSDYAARLRTDERNRRREAEREAERRYDERLRRWEEEEMQRLTEANEAEENRMSDYPERQAAHDQLKLEQQKERRRRQRIERKTEDRMLSDRLADLRRQSAHLHRPTTA